MSNPLLVPESESVLCGLLLSRADLGLFERDVLRLVAPDDFADERAREVWAAATELETEGVDLDSAAVRERLRERGRLDVERWAGERAVLAPQDGMPRYHAGIVRDRAVRRRLAEAARELATDAGRLDVKLADVLDRAERRVFQLADTGDGANSTLVKSHLLPVFGLLEAGGYKGTPTGFLDVDPLLTGGGFLPGQLVVVAGATSMGKTAWAQGVALHTAIAEKQPVAYCSIEMTARDNTLRFLAMEARADLRAMCTGGVHGADMERLTQAAGLLNAAPLYLQDHATTLPEIRNEARRLKHTHGLHLLVVDHMQDMEHHAESRREQLGGIARGLKALAKELDITVLAVSQLSRSVEQRPNARPRAADLKESGDIENSADTVLMLYRPEYYEGTTDENRGKAEIIIAKQRNGPTGTVPLHWSAFCVRYDNAAREARYAAA